MSKICIACGAAPEPPAKPADQPEDCPHCGAKNSVAEVEENNGEEEE